MTFGHLTKRGLLSLCPCAANYKHSFLNIYDFGNLANALSALPEEYTGNVETQRNWREFIKLVEHVV